MKLAFSTLMISGLVFAAGETAVLKVGLVDLQKSLQSVESGKSAKAALEKEVNTKKASLEKQQAQLQKDAEEFEKKAAILNDTAKAQKQQELQKKFAELQKAAAESQMDLQKRERELTKPIIDDIRAIVEVIGKEKNYNLVFEKNESGVLYAQNSEDITDQVIERFNKKKKG